MSAPRARNASRVVLNHAVPGFFVRATLAVVVTAVSVAATPPGFWLGITLLIGALAVAVPRTHAAWAWMLFVTAALLADQASSVDGRAAVALLGIHAVHVLSALALLVPWNTRIEAVALARLVPGFLAIQLPSQLLLAGCLIVLGRRSEFDALPLLAPLGAVCALAVITLLVHAVAGAAADDQRR